jgi:hypothetical protein
VQSSHASKILKIESHYAFDKGKFVVAPSSPSNDPDKFVSSWMHLRDDCSHVISEIKPKGSIRKTGPWNNKIKQMRKQNTEGTQYKRDTDLRGSPSVGYIHQRNF